MKIIDLHTHTFLSDGDLIPSELVRRAMVSGYSAIALTDHVDSSNIESIISSLIEVSEKLTKYLDIKVIPGAELTHTPPDQIPDLAEKAKTAGARLILVHGETIAEPVAPGTNLAALNSPIHILAHPGLITEEQTKLAAENNIYLELSSRKDHSLTNGHVAQMALKHGAKLLLNTDAHSETDLLTSQQWLNIARGAGLNDAQIEQLKQNSLSIVNNIFSTTTTKTKEGNQ